MKSLLRSSLVVLMVFAGYAALATGINKPSSNAGPLPMCVPSNFTSQGHANFGCQRPN